MLLPIEATPLFYNSNLTRAPAFKNRDGTIGYVTQQRAYIDPQGGVTTEDDTLITADLSFPEWRNGMSGGGTLSTLAAQETLGPFLFEGVQLNAKGDESGDVPKSTVFTPNPGCTSVLLTVPIKLPTGTVGSKNVSVKFYASNMSTVIATTTVALTSTLVFVTLTLTGVTSGTLYGIGIHTNDAGQQANPIIGRVTLKPNAGTGTFEESFTRLRIGSSVVAGNICDGWNTGIYPYLSPNSDIIIHTDATRIATESYGSSIAGTMSALYSGMPWYNGTSIANGTLGFDDFALPYAGTPDNVTIRTGTGLAALGNVLGKYQGLFTRAIYLPKSAGFTLMPFNTRNLCIGVGDSLILGNASSDLPFTSWSARFRAQYPGNFAIDAHNSRTLFDYAGTFAQQEAMAKFYAKYQPAHMIWDLGVNDRLLHPWPGSGATAAGNFAAALFNVIDIMRDLSPNTVHCVKTACPLTSEVDLGNGTQTQFRTAMSNGITTSRAQYCFLVDGTTLATTTELDVDGVHGTTRWHGMVGSGMVAAFAARVPPEL